jgi:hypothetical protein
VRWIALAFAASAALGAPTAVTGSDAPPTTSASRRLEIFYARTPRLPVPGFVTSGRYPQVAHADTDLRRVNRRLRLAILQDEREFARYALKEKPRLDPAVGAGAYKTAVDRRYAFASPRLVSFLMPMTRELFPGQHGGDGWLGVTVVVPSGSRVTIGDLFANRTRGLRVLARDWKKRTMPCSSIYAEAYTPTIRNYGEFALTPRGLVVGSNEVGACYRLSATIPYRLLRPYFSAEAKKLVAVVRADS